MRMTKQRQLILSLISDKQQPLSAEMIYEKLPDKSMNLSTVYRVLDYFFLHDIINKTTIQNIAYYFLKTAHHHHYFICTTCQKMFPVDCHFFDEDDLEKKGFKVSYHDITVYGTCPACQAKES